MSSDGARAALAVAAAAIIGATIRWGVAELPAISASWPTATFVVNVAGAAIIGWLIAAQPAPITALAGRVGFCGALTTFSTMTVETATFARDDRWLLALTYPLATVVAGAACFVGATRWACR